nr:outer membrane protein assembly factor BamA [Paraburkholderia humisilvae]
MTAASASVADSFATPDIKIECLRRVQPCPVFTYLPRKSAGTLTGEFASAAVGMPDATDSSRAIRTVTKGDQMALVREPPAVASTDFAGIHELYLDNVYSALKPMSLSESHDHDKSLVDKAEQEFMRQYMACDYGYCVHEVSRSSAPLDETVIGQIDFIGNNAFPSSQLLEEMQLSRKSWFSWYTKNDLYAKGKLLVDLGHIRQYCLNRGYLEFNITSIHIAFLPDKKAVDLTVAVHEGEPYTIASVKLVGNLIGREAELQKLIKMKTGDRFSAQELQDTAKALISKLAEYGFASATVSLQPDVDHIDHRIGIALVVDPGRRAHVRYIKITGNTRTHDEVIRREMRQMENAWLDTNRLAASKERISRVGYFTSVDVSTSPVPGTQDQYDINVNVTEKPPSPITLGVGYTSDVGSIVSAGISQDNVFGSGTSLAVNASIARTFRAGTVTQVDPYFTAEGVKRVTDIYYRTAEPLYYSNTNDTSFRIINYGFDTKFGIPFSERDTLYLGAGIEQHRIDVDATTPQSYIDYVNSFGRVSNDAPLILGWARDTRDSVLVPSHGYWASANGEYGTPITNTTYYKLDLGAQYYYSFMRGFVLGLNFRAGYGSGLSGRPFPIFTNFRAGGIGSVRGYEPNSLGPRDKSTNDPVGGSKLVVGNLELTFPLPRGDYDRTLRVFSYFDFGNVWGAEGSIVGGNGLRYSYGVGLEWISPIGPLKLDVGFPITRHSGDQYQKFQFQVGTSF